MRVDLAIVEGQLEDAAAGGELAAAAGVERVVATESTSDPFLQCLHAHAHGAPTVATGIAVAFARTPMATAYPCWDLAGITGGGFHLGLGTQVRGHVERRFSMPWSAPVERMREYVGALRAIWSSWRDGSRLDFHGEFYRHDLMTPVFTPRAHPHEIPIALAAVGPRMTRLAGEVADGLIVHGFTNAAHLDGRALPALEEGLAISGRSRRDVEVTGTVFVLTGTDQQIAERREDARRRVGFYASTPGYVEVLDAIGHAEVQPELSQLAREKRWAEMDALVSDDMLGQFVVEGPPDEIGARIVERYGGRLDRIASYYGWDGMDPEQVGDIARAVATASA